MNMNSGNSSVWSGRAGWALSGLTAVGLVMSAAMKLQGNPMVLDQLVGKFGFQSGSIAGIGILELTCALLYLIPRTSVLGAILVTGYLGGAVASHVRVSDAFVPPLALGVFAWAGLYLRDERIRRLIPLVRPLCVR